MESSPGRRTEFFAGSSICRSSKMLVTAAGTLFFSCAYKPGKKLKQMMHTAMYFAGRMKEILSRMITLPKTKLLIKSHRAFLTHPVVHVTEDYPACIYQVLFALLTFY